MKTSADTYFSRNYRHKLWLTTFVFAILTLSACAPLRQPAPPYPPPLEDKRPADIESTSGKRQRVIASWYGADYHGRPTASGEIFNMYALTCAHREFPFGTMLRVSNPANKKTTECTVNDRGPFIEGRHLDLSYESARRIDLIGPGVAPVDIEPFGRDRRYIKTVKTTVTSGTLTVQTGSFKEETNALRMKAGLEFRYRDVYIMPVLVGGVKHYRVRVGIFKDASEALRIAQSLAQEGYDALITRYENP